MMKKHTRIVFTALISAASLYFSACGATDAAAPANTADSASAVPVQPAADSASETSAAAASETAPPAVTIAAPAEIEAPVPTYPISFIGDAFRYEQGLASVVLQNGDVCVINEEGTPLVLFANTTYAEWEENELHIPDILRNGCFSFIVPYSKTSYGEYIFSHDGKLLQLLTVGTDRGCDTEEVYETADSILWVTVQGGFDAVSYELHSMDAEGNVTVQPIADPEDIRNDLPVTEYVPTPEDELAEKLREGALKDRFFDFHLRSDGTAVVVCAGADDQQYYAYAASDGTLTTEMMPLHADGAVFCGENLLLIQLRPEYGKNCGALSMLDTQTGTVTDLHLIGAIDGTNSRYALRAYGEPGAQLASGQIRRTNFIRPDGTLLFQQDADGNPVIAIPDSVPRY